jgi:hypothetical protein
MAFDCCMGDADRLVQIADFSPIRLETGEMESFSGEK